MAPAAQPSYGKDEKVLCFHHDILYEAKILDLRRVNPSDIKSPYEYQVHYKGWKNTYVFLLLPRHCLRLCLFGSFDLPRVWWPLSERVADRTSWDDWVPQERLRKYNEENRDLATTLRRDLEASLRRTAKPSSRRKTGGSDRSSARGSEERQSSAPRGTKRNRDNEIEKEDSFYSRPSIKIALPDNLKSLLVDDWENITKNRQVVALPAKWSVNAIMEEYAAEGNASRQGTVERDVLDEVTSGIKEYFDKALDKILLYKFEREQFRLLRKKWDDPAGQLAGKGPLDTYGAEHLARLFGMFPFVYVSTYLPAGRASC